MPVDLVLDQAKAVRRAGDFHCREWTRQHDAMEHSRQGIIETQQRSDVSQ